MAENTNTNGQKSPDGAAAQAQEQPAVQVQVVAQYIKDLSFENPNVQRLLKGPGDNPNMKLEVNVNARNVEENLYESAIELAAHATSKAGTIYEMELVYAGLFRIDSIPKNALEPFLLINCPALIFPFVRRLVADLSREGGFPPLLLDPIDFGNLYMQRKKHEAEQAQAKPSS